MCNRENTVWNNLFNVTNKFFNTFPFRCDTPNLNVAFGFINKFLIGEFDLVWYWLTTE